MPRLNYRGSSGAVTYEYSLSKIYNLASSVEWVYEVLQRPELAITKVKLASLDELKSRELVVTPEGIEKILTPKSLVLECTKDNITEIKIEAETKGSPIVIGIDLKTYLPFITVTKSSRAELYALESQLSLI